MILVPDAGAGPNLIRAELLLQKFLDKHDQSKEIFNLESDSKHRLDVVGIVLLTVTVKTRTIRLHFVSVAQLGTNVILGCHNIDKAVYSI